MLNKLQLHPPGGPHSHRLTQPPTTTHLRDDLQRVGCPAAVKAAQALAAPDGGKRIQLQRVGRSMKEQGNRREGMAGLRF